MTLFLPTDAVTGTLAVNTPNLTPGTYYLAVQSQYNKNVWAWELTLLSSNERYSEFSYVISEDERKAHINGIYNYELQSETSVIEGGLLKMITEEGGSTGTQEYVSDKETTEAYTYYRPEY